MQQARPTLPGWVRPASRVIITLQRLGIAFSPLYGLAVPGRRSGLMRATVVSPFVVESDRYLLSFGQLDWYATHARRGGATYDAAGAVTLVEVKPPESAKIVGEFPRQI